MNPEIQRLLEGFVKNPGATSGAIDKVTSALELALPADYIECLHHMNGGEGWVGQSYLRLYPVEKLIPLNLAYGVEEFAPGLFIFGSSGGGEAFAFDHRITPLSIVKIPFIPMDFAYMEQCGSTFEGFVHSLAKEGETEVSSFFREITQKAKGFLGIRSRSTPSISPSLIGKEIHELTPVVFGGHPTDPENKTLLTLEAHAETIVAWNRIYRNMKGK